MEASINPPRSRFRNVLQMTAWIVGAIAIWIAEILVFERWGYVTGLKILAAAILISGFVLMGVGLRRLKIASDTNGKEYSYGHGVNAIMLSAVITSGAAIGQQLYFQKAWYWSVPAPLFRGRQSVFLIALDTIHESIHIAGLMARSLA